MHTVRIRTQSKPNPGTKSTGSYEDMILRLRDFRGFDNESMNRTVKELMFGEQTIGLSSFVFFSIRFQNLPKMGKNLNRFSAFLTSQRVLNLHAATAL